MRGETTTATPVRLKPDAAEDVEPDATGTEITAGAWKHSDLPPPVGRTTTLSRESRTACMASRCSGRKSEKPQTRCRTSSSRRSASGVGAFDVIIDQLLEFGCELVVGAA